MKPTANTTRERIVAAASKLFYGQGVRAVSVDAVAEKAGLTKRTFYYHFASKDDLIAAYLERRDQPNLGLFRHWFTESGGELADKVTAIFRTLGQAARRPAWKGCGFLRTAAELADMPGHPAIRIGIAHKKRFEDWLKTVFEADGILEAELLARQILLLLDGCFATVLLNRDPSYMDSAAAAAATLVRAAQAQRPL